MVKDGKVNSFGLYDTVEEARKVAAEKRKELYGDFA